MHVNMLGNMHVNMLGNMHVNLLGSMLGNMHVNMLGNMLGNMRGTTGVFTKTATQIWRCYRWEWVPAGQTIKPGGYASKPNILHIVVISQHFTAESLPVSAMLNLPVQLRFCTAERRF